jgi:hypothetical protein
MIVIAVVVVVAAGIGAALGVERRVEVRCPGAQPPHHVLDHMVAADHQPIAVEHGRQMPVAEVPRDANEVAQIVAADFSERLGRGDDFHLPSILQHQPIPLPQPVGLFEIEQEFKRALGAHDDAPTVPAIEIEADAGDGRHVVTTTVFHDGHSANHGQFRIFKGRWIDIAANLVHEAGGGQRGLVSHCNTPEAA